MNTANRIEALAAETEVTLVDRGNDSNDIVTLAEALELESASYAGNDENHLDLMVAELEAE